MGNARTVAVAAVLFWAAGVVSAQQSDDGYVPTLPKNYLPQEVKSPFQVPFGGWGISMFRWAELMGTTPFPPNPHSSFSVKPLGSTILPKPAFKLPGLPYKPVSGGTQNTGAAPWYNNFCFARIKYGLCQHQLKWSGGWTQLPLSATGIRVVGPMADAYGHPNLIYTLLYVGSQWGLAGKKPIRVYGISTKDPLETYIDNQERTWWFSHMAGIDLKQKEILREFLRPGASYATLKGVLSKRMATNGSLSPYLPDTNFVYDGLEDRLHVGGHSVDIQEYDNTRSNLALLRAIGESRPIASAYIWNGISETDASHFIAPPKAVPQPTGWTTYGLSPLHVALKVSNDPMKPIWNEYGKDLSAKLSLWLGIHLVQKLGYSWQWESWGQYYGEQGGGGLFQ